MPVLFDLVWMALRGHPCFMAGFVNEELLYDSV